MPNFNPEDIYKHVDVDRVIDGRIASGWQCPQKWCTSETHYVITMHLPQLELRCVQCETVHCVEL